MGGLLDTAWRLIEDGRFTDAERLLLEGSAQSGAPYRTPGPEPGAMAHALGYAYLSMGRFVDSRRWLEKAVADRDFAGLEDAELARMLGDLAGLHRTCGELLDAMRRLDRAEAIQQSLSQDHPDVGVILQLRGLTMRDAGGAAQALPLLRRGTAIVRNGLGADHPQVIAGLKGETFALILLHDRQRAGLVCRQVLDLCGRTLRPRHPTIAGAILNAGRLALQHHHLEASDQLTAEALSIYREALGADTTWDGLTLGHLSDLRLAQGRHREAEEAARAAIQIYERVHGASHWFLASFLMRLHDVLGDAGSEEAEEIAERLAALDPAPTADGLQELAATRYESGDLDECRRLLEDGLRLVPDEPGLLEELAALEEVLGHADEAAGLRRRVLEAAERHAQY